MDAPSPGRTRLHILCNLSGSDARPPRVQRGPAYVSRQPRFILPDSDMGPDLETLVVHPLMVPE